MVINNLSCFTRPRTDSSKPAIGFACRRAVAAVTVIRESDPLNWSSAISAAALSHVKVRAMTMASLLTQKAKRAALNVQCSKFNAQSSLLGVRQGFEWKTLNLALEL